MLICLLRHGETDWNNTGRLQGREDIPLNSTGITQAREAAVYLKKYNWQAIITSPLARAKKTAEIVSREIGNVKIYEDAGFIERDYGKASGMTAAERKAAFLDENNMGMEPFEVMQNRTVTALHEHTRKFDGCNIIIVTHGMALNSILAHVSGNKAGTGKTVLKNASITLLQKTNGAIKILCMNKTADELAADDMC